MSGRGPNRGTSREVTSRARCNEECLREKRQSGPERAVPQHVLHIEGLEIPRSEQSTEHQQHDGVATRDVARAEDVEWHQRRLRHPGLEIEEDSDQDDAQRQWHEHLRGAPGVGLGPDDTEDDRDQTGGHRDGAAQVEVPVAQVRPRLGDVTERGQQRDGPDGHVHEEDPAPAQELDQDASEEGARRRAGRGHGTPGAQCLGPRRPFGEARRQDGQRRRGEDGRPQALHGPGTDQPGLVLGQPAEEARRREHREADQEHLATTEKVGRPAAQQEETGERQRVGVHDPLQSRSAEPQVVLDGREGDVHDGGVEHHHELADEDQAEHQPRRYRFPRCDLYEAGAAASAVGVAAHESPSDRNVPDMSAQPP